MNKIPNPFLNINFLAIINEEKCYNNFRFRYNSKDNFKKYLKMIENSIINNCKDKYSFYFYNNQIIEGIPVGIDSNYLYLENKKSIKLKEIQKIRYCG